MAKGPLFYTLDLRLSDRRRLEVTLEVPMARDVAAMGLEFFLPAWTPGSYLIREYARQLSDFQVEDTAETAGDLEDGLHRKGVDGARGVREVRPVAWTKTRKNCYLVHPFSSCRRLRIRYGVYAHELSVRTSDLSSDHAFLSGAGIYLWPRDARDAHDAHDARDPEQGGAWRRREVEIRILAPEAWELATSLTWRREAPGVFRLEASGLDQLVDSPCLLGKLQRLTFQALGKRHSFVLDGLCGLRPPERMLEDAKAIVEAAAAVFGGEVPYEEYQFLCMFAETGRGGLEHLASSALLAPRTTFHPEKEYHDFMGLVAHEYFHVFNVKRMRPQELWEVDYEEENYTELLWVAEGFTAYYDDHLCLRAGILTPKRYLEIISKGIADLRRTPGRLVHSLSEASFDAWIRLYRPDENTRNSTQSYYGNGALAALCLDLRIREKTNGERSLDSAMHSLYQSTYEQGRGYTRDDVLRCLSEAADSDLAPFLDELVSGPLDPDFAGVLAGFGLVLREEPGNKPYLGLHFRSQSLTVSSVLRDSPSDLAGIQPGDEILALQGLRASSANWSRLFEQVAGVGEPMDALLSRRGRVLTLPVSPCLPPVGTLSIEIDEDATPAQVGLRKGWLWEDRGSESR